MDKEERFIIEDYNRAKAFSSFLPSIAGLYGKPVWAFYVNRGQCMAGIGVNNKDYSIMEFQPANKAYRQTPLQGFRTFLKIVDRNNGEVIYYEPFQDKPDYRESNTVQRMSISSYDLKLVEINKTLGIKIEIIYCTLPGEFLSALIRQLSIKNIGDRDLAIEVLDGLPVIIPYYLTNNDMKNESNLRQAWMGVKNYNTIPFYKIDILPYDTSETMFIEGGNFYLNFAFTKNKYNKSEIIIDPDLIFGSRTDFSYPQVFYEDDFVVPEEQVNSGKTPCGFGYKKILLKKGETDKTYTLLGNCGEYKRLENFVKNKISKGYMEGKISENKKLIEGLKSRVFTVSNAREFDLYSGQTFLDNFLRGGYPVSLSNGKHIFYVYSRKHGDLEREYNFFQIDAAYFSQGNANFRDVNQNRRNDIRFFPFIEENNIKTFFNLIQLDGYNPLVLKGSGFEIDNTKMLSEIVGKYFNRDDGAELKEYLATEFTPGELIDLIEINDITIAEEKLAGFLDDILAVSNKIEQADFKEGYWVDHWTYNIDLLEQYMAVYPDKVMDLLLTEKVFSYYDSCYRVLPRSKKYVLTDNGVRQYQAVEKDYGKEKMIRNRERQPDKVRTKNGKGEIYYTTLFAKIVCLLVNKIASLDPSGVGIEMEADKPGWCDALNGLPGLLGSSLNISLEIKRCAELMLEVFEKYNVDDDLTILIPEELYRFFIRINDLLQKDIEDYTYWDMSNQAKEEYRESIIYGITGEEVTLKVKTAKAFLLTCCSKIDQGLVKAYVEDTDIYYTYFINQVEEYEKISDKDGRSLVKALSFKQSPLPYFLEGPVHYLRINKDKEKAAALYKSIKKTGLYDRKLKMYRVNDNIMNETKEIGRQNVFPRGWLENEAVFLHMEYKYLLELLRSGLYEEFFADIKNTLVPFLNPVVYGRSILENSSFIASSVHPDKKLHGRGFVSRLTGASAEFLTMWHIMTAGAKPFFLDDTGQLCLEFAPVLPDWLFTEGEESITYYQGLEEKNLKIPANSFAFNFLGGTLVIYHNRERKNTFGKDGAVISDIMVYQDRRVHHIKDNIIRLPYSELIRRGFVERIEVFFR